MLDSAVAWLLDPSGLTPHGFCLLWQPGLIWAHALSDILIGCAYFTIPLALGLFARKRRDLVFRPVFWLFAAFILLCGTTHWLGLLTLWVPAYGLDAAVKAATAIVSVVTAVALWRLLPQALALPSPTQLQEAHAALLESEARHRRSFERSPIPMHMLDEAGRVTSVSDSWLGLLGYERAAVIGRPVTEFQAPGARRWSEQDHSRLLADGELHDIERDFVRPDGTVVAALLAARTERLGAETWAVCVLVDITARRRAEEALRQSEERLHQAQKMEAVGQLTGGIAHDFNNMLQGISGGLDLMERRIAQGEPEKAATYVGAVRQSLDRAASLTQRMLAFARRQALQPQAVHPDTLVLGLEELIRRTVGPTISLQLELHDGRWPALCDPNQLESALINLAINARDAMPDGGRLVIATADRHLDRADLVDEAEAEPGDYVEIAVSDNGIGMPANVLGRAFEPFFTTKPTGQGTGLGLSQLYGFVRQSGGLVRLQSVVGQGTTVQLFLPRCAAASLPGGDGELDALPMPPSERVRGRALVVDDEDMVRTQIADALQDLGLTVLEAADGPGGLRIIQTTTPIDLLITDVGLPGLNGRQLAEAARARRPELPVLLITGYAGTALDELTLAPGMQILRKPFSLDALIATAHEMLAIPVASSPTGPAGHASATPAPA